MSSSYLQQFKFRNEELWVVEEHFNIDIFFSFSIVNYDASNQHKVN